MNIYIIIIVYYKRVISITTKHVYVIGLSHLYSVKLRFSYQRSQRVMHMSYQRLLGRASQERAALRLLLDQLQHLSPTSDAPRFGRKKRNSAAEIVTFFGEETWGFTI